MQDVLILFAVVGGFLGVAVALLFAFRPARRRKSWLWSRTGEISDQSGGYAMWWTTEKDNWLKLGEPHRVFAR